MIARHFLIAGVTYLTLVIQPSLTQGLAHAAFRPWLPALAVVAMVAWMPGISSLIWAGILGLGVDCLSGDRLGLHLIASTLVAFGLGAIRFNGRSRSILAALYVFLGTFLWRLGTAALSAQQLGPELNLGDLVRRVEIDGVSTALLLFVVLLICRPLFRPIDSGPSSAVSLSNRWSMLTGS